MKHAIECIDFYIMTPEMNDGCNGSDDDGCHDKKVYERQNSDDDVQLSLLFIFKKYSCLSLVTQADINKPFALIVIEKD